MGTGEVLGRLDGDTLKLPALITAFVLELIKHRLVIPGLKVSTLIIVVTRLGLTKLGNWGLGPGAWGLGRGDWGLGNIRVEAFKMGVLKLRKFRLGSFKLGNFRLGKLRMGNLRLENRLGDFRLGIPTLEELHVELFDGIGALRNLRC